MTSGRSDDNLDSIRKRFRTFDLETKPVGTKCGKAEVMSDEDRAMSDEDRAL